MESTLERPENSDTCANSTERPTRFDSRLQAFCPFSGSQHTSTLPSSDVICLCHQPSESSMRPWRQKCDVSTQCILRMCSCRRHAIFTAFYCTFHAQGTLEFFQKMHWLHSPRETACGGALSMSILPIVLTHKVHQCKQWSGVQVLFNGD